MSLELKGSLNSMGSLQAAISYYGRSDGGSKIVFYDTTANWNSKLDFIPKAGVIVVYSDYSTVDGVDVPNIKIGDGLAYLVDLPFVDSEMRDMLMSHIVDRTQHVTSEERDFWNNKISCYIESIVNEDYRIIFTKD